MSSIKERINQDLKEAMKNLDTFKRDTLRMLNSAFKQVEVDQRKNLCDEDIVKILRTACKQREEAAKAYKNGGREDLYQKETKEIEIILSYLPKQLEDHELKQAIQKIILEISAEGKKDMGRVMEHAKNLNADGRRIANFVKDLLN